MKSLQQIMNEFIIKVLRDQSFYSERARVTAVDPENNTCTVITMNDNSELFKVIINAYRGAKYGVFPVPKVGSVVTVSYYDRNEAYVAKMGELERLSVVFHVPDSESEGTTVEITDERILIGGYEGGTTIDISSGEIIFNGGEQNGLVKVQEMSDRLNDLEMLFKKLQQDFNLWVPVPTDGGTALKVTLTAGFLLQPVPTSKISDFENEKIIQ